MEQSNVDRLNEWIDYSFGSGDKESEMAAVNEQQQQQQQSDSDQKVALFTSKLDQSMIDEIGDSKHLRADNSHEKLLNKLAK